MYKSVLLCRSYGNPVVCVDRISCPPTTNRSCPPPSPLRCRPWRGESISPLDKSKPHAHHKNQLATLNGVYVPCCLNIMGIILFLRMGWGVSQAGVLGTLIIAVAETMAILTVLSFSAIVTNGEMAGGGSYFMISAPWAPSLVVRWVRSSTWLMPWASRFYIIGFATEVQSTWFNDVTDATSVRWLTVGIGSAGLLFILGISVIGADAFAKFNVWFFVIQFGAIIIGIGSYVLAGPHNLETQEYKECLFYCNSDTLNQHYTGNSSATSGPIVCTKALFNMCLDGNLTYTVVTGPSAENFAENLWWNFTDTKIGASRTSTVRAGGTCTVTMVFSILFPMATGIMEGQISPVTLRTRRDPFKGHCVRFAIGNFDLCHDCADYGRCFPTIHLEGQYECHAGGLCEQVCRRCGHHHINNLICTRISLVAAVCYKRSPKMTFSPSLSRLRRAQKWGMSRAVLSFSRGRLRSAVFSSATLTPLHP